MNVHHTIPIAVLGLFFQTAGALAQLNEAQTGEISFYSGLAAGGLGTHPAVGGSVGNAFSRYCVALIDTSFVPLGERTLRSYPGVVTASSRLYDFNASVHIRVPVKQRWGPYAIIGGAFLFNTYDKQVTAPGGAVRFEGKSHSAFGFETGGGARYHVTETWGFRAEYRYTVSDHSFSRVLAGVFIEVSSDFPFWNGLRGRRGHHNLN